MSEVHQALVRMHASVGEPENDFPILNECHKRISIVIGSKPSRRGEVANGYGFSQNPRE